MNKRRPRLLPSLFATRAKTNTRFQGGWLLGLLTIIAATPVKADTANFGTISLAPGFNTTNVSVSGYTGGSYSLSAISNRDRDNKACIGFADPNPDHILVLEKDFSELKVAVRSGGSDTTILIQGPDNTIYCGDDSGKRKDASVEGRNWKAGNYKVWVGTFNPNVKLNYNLTVEQP
jgi:hypothetical protein